MSRGLPLPPSPPTRIRTGIPPPFCPTPQSPGPPKACLPVSRAPLRPALFLVMKGTSTPISAPRPSRWYPLGMGGVLRGAHPFGGGTCCNWSPSDQTFFSAVSVAEPLFMEVKPTPTSSPPPLGGLLDRSGHGAVGVVSIMVYLSVCPRISSL